MKSILFLILSAFTLSSCTFCVPFCDDEDDYYDNSSYNHGSNSSYNRGYNDGYEERKKRERIEDKSWIRDKAEK